MNQNYKRFFSETTHKRAVLSDGEHHHLAHVLRMRIGDRIVLFNGDDFDYHYQIDEIARDHTKLTLVEMVRNRVNPTIRVAVFVGLIRSDNLHIIVEKLNEIGATDLFLFTSNRTNVRTASVNIEKLQSIATQSCKQCGRSTPTTVHAPLTFDQMIQTLDGFQKVYYADRAEKRDKIQQRKMTTSESVALVIGPEGGMDMDENLALAAVAEPVTLGPRTLRSETATIVATTIIMNKLGQL
ncbi:MAG: 16S rRNA (uracil(1498)-N(3))-methyltransferase [Firmicutes bacterium]|nr:16S rRNA (uracil(1498)-N(3))-methyltransferase [Bacillota bacterium]